MYRVLIVCTGNLCRSPMAAGLLRKSLTSNLQGKVDVTSAGTNTLDYRAAAPYAIKAAAAHGIDISDHLSRLISRDIITDANLIICMEKQHHFQIKRVLPSKYFKMIDLRLLGEFGSPTPIGNIEDPYGKDYKEYQKTMKTMQLCMQNLIFHIDKIVNPE